MFSLASAMEGAFNYDELVINGVRSRKKHSEVPSCPVCGCTVRPAELEAHLAVELDRLGKINASGKRRISGSVAGSSRSQPAAGPSTDMDTEVDVTGCTGGDVYQRVKSNRMRRLRTRSRRVSTSPPESGECPVCAVRMPVSRLWRHARRCLRRTGAPADDDDAAALADTSSDDEGSIDVENDESDAGAGGGGGGFGAEYRWCGEWRVRAAALASPEARDATTVRRASTDTQLIVDGDEDCELYGPPQYSPSRIDPDSDRPLGASAPESSADNGETADVITADAPEPAAPPAKGYNGLVQASAEARIQALTSRIRELESRQPGGMESKCLICLSAYAKPVVSVQCWHVYCEVCWLESLRAKKICPQCNAITTAQHLRRIYM